MTSAESISSSGNHMPPISERLSEERLLTNIASSASFICANIRPIEGRFDPATFVNQIPDSLIGVVDMKDKGMQFAIGDDLHAKKYYSIVSSYAEGTTTYTHNRLDLVAKLPFAHTDKTTGEKKFGFASIALAWRLYSTGDRWRRLPTGDDEPLPAMVLEILLRDLKAIGDVVAVGRTQAYKAKADFETEEQKRKSFFEKKRRDEARHRALIAKRRSQKQPAQPNT